MFRRGYGRVVTAAFLLEIYIIILQQRFYYGHSQKHSPTHAPLNEKIPVVYDDREVELVVAKVSYENTSWLFEYFPAWYKRIYVVDDQAAALTVPANKGHESMVYLT